MLNEVSLGERASLSPTLHASTRARAPPIALGAMTEVPSGKHTARALTLHAPAQAEKHGTAKAAARAA